MSNYKRSDMCQAADDFADGTADVKRSGMGLKTHAISSAFSYAFPFHKASFYMPKASFFMPKNAYEAKTELFNAKLFGIEK